MPDLVLTVRKAARPAVSPNLPKAEIPKATGIATVVGLYLSSELTSCCFLFLMESTHVLSFLAIEGLLDDR